MKVPFAVNYIMILCVHILITFLHIAVSVAIIGFAPVTYTVLENEGPVNFNFAVLQGNIAFDLAVLFFTTGGSATSKQYTDTIIKMYNCTYIAGCLYMAD